MPVYSYKFSGKEVLAANSGSATISGSLNVTGSLNIKDLLTLTPRTTTPTSPATGSLIMSASGVSGMSLFLFTGTGSNSGWGRIPILSY